MSGILSQNENLTVNIVQDNTATYTIDMSGGDMGKVEYVEGEGFVFSGGKAPLGKLSDVLLLLLMVLLLLPLMKWLIPLNKIM